jgi:hypothetical protein
MCRYRAGIALLKTGAVIAVVFALVLLGGCAAPTASREPAPAGAPSPPFSFLARSAGIGQPGSWAIEVDVTNNALYEVQLVGTGENEQVLSAAGTVRLRGNGLKVKAGLPQGTTKLVGSGSYRVTRRGSGFSVAVPLRDGGPRTYDFSPDRPGDYNAIVTRLDGAAQEALAIAAQQQQGPRRQVQRAEAAQLEAKAARACSAVGGQIQGHVTVGAGGVSMDAYCAADPNRTWANPAGANHTRADPGGAKTCSGLTVPFNNDGTLDLGYLQNTEWSYPGCFG